MIEGIAIKGTAMMYCEKYSCKMAVAACVARRQTALSDKRSDCQKFGYSDPGCQDCYQGAKIAAMHDPEKVRQYRAEIKAVKTNAIANLQASKEHPSQQELSPPKQKRRGRKAGIVVEIDGESLTVPQWSQKYGVPSKIIYIRLRLDWPAREAVMRPVNSRRKTKSQASRPPEFYHGQHVKWDIIGPDEGYIIGYSAERPGHIVVEGKQGLGYIRREDIVQQETA